MSFAFAWRTGDEKLRRALEDVLLAADPEAAGLEVLVERPGRRRLARLRLPSGEVLFLKHFFCAGHRHALLERAKNALGLSSAERERRALARLGAAGVAVPELRALAVLPGGDRLIATRHLEGRTLHEALAEGGEGRAALLAAVGALVRRLHESGSVHRDLHGGNVLVTRDGPVILDLAGARQSRGRAARWRDVGALDDSLAGLLSTADRVRLRAAALGLRRPFGAAARRALRAVADASAARARARAARRTRRARAPGQSFARLRFGDYRGLRLVGAKASAVLAALAAQRSATGAGDWILLKSDGRSRVTAGPTEAGSMVVKQYAAGGLARAVADAFRGSPARRAWLGGHGLRLRGIAAATPYAFVERRRLGLPVASAAVFEDLRPAAPADRCGPSVASPEQLVDALARLVTRLHRCGAIHGDLKASHLYLEWRGDRLEARPIDLEGVRFRSRLRDAQRIRALAELNASLPDSIADDLRCRAFARCAAALPFERGSEATLREIVAASLRRNHRWTGAGCAIAARLPGGRRGERRARVRYQRLTTTQRKELEEPGTRPP